VEDIMAEAGTPNFSNVDSKADTNGGNESQSSDGTRDERKNIWPRICYMVGYGMAANMAFWAMVFLTIAQAIFILSSGNGNSELKVFTGQLSSFMKQAMDFVIFQSEEKPFPFQAFPEANRSKD
jgi:hypothetical protein